MKRLIYFLSIVSLMVLAPACSDKKSDEPTPPAVDRPADRTVLVYMVANNDLGQRGYDDADITEMRRGAAAGALDRARLVVMHQDENGNSVLKEITAKGEVDTLMIYDSAEPSVSIARMRRTIADVKRLAPASHYGLVMWSHGSGWLEDGWADPAKGVLRGFGLDGKKIMNTTALAEAVDGQDFDYIYFDCCHMASVEVAYELRHATPYIVGSVTELPNYGMPYDKNLPMLAAAVPDLTGAAASTFDSYDKVVGSGRSCTISVIATSGLDALAEATRRVYSTATPLAAGLRPQPFESGSNCRFHDMEEYMEMIATDADALDAWRQALAGTVLYSAATPSIFNTLTIKRHCGLSTYTPAGADDMNRYGYNNLQWAADVAATLPWTK